MLDISGHCYKIIKKLPQLDAPDVKRLRLYFTWRFFSNLPSWGLHLRQAAKKRKESGTTNFRFFPSLSFKYELQRLFGEIISPFPQGKKEGKTVLIWAP